VDAMIRIDVDQEALEAVQHRIGHMLQSLDHLGRVDIGHELSEWQTEDMGRNRPFTMRSRARHIASTVIRPHSKYEVERSIRYQRMGGRRIARLLGLRTKRGWKKAQSAFHAFEPKTSMRPILRAKMLERLSERLLEMAAEKLKW
jgi:hypothetical protein